MEHVSEFKYLWLEVDELSANGTKRRRKMTNGIGIAGEIRSLGSDRSFQPECTMALYNVSYVYSILV